MIDTLDTLVIPFRAEGRWLLGVALGFIVFAVALHLDRRDLVQLRRQPRAAVLGLAGQWLLLPLLTVGLIALLSPPPGIAAGMLLVAACPGGSMSNYFCLQAQGNVLLSVALTTVSTALAALTLPLIFSVGTTLLPALASTTDIPRVAFLPLLRDLAVILLMPLLLGLLVQSRLPLAARRMRRPLRRSAGALLMLFIALALLDQRTTLMALGGQLLPLLGLVALHNGLALAGGYGLGALGGLAEAERRTLALETGLQNAGLGLVVAFTHFGGAGGMVVVVSLWGIWHLISGALVSWAWARRSPLPEEPEHAAL